VKLPKNILIGPYQVTIEEWTQSPDDLWGEYCHESKRIRVEDSGNSVLNADTLLHEILHSLWETNHLREGDDEERIVSVMASAQIQLIKDNPKLFKLICSMVEDS